MATFDDNHQRDKVLDWNSFCPEISISHDLIHRMRELRERFEKITNDWSKISMLEKEGKRRLIPKWKPIETTSLLDESMTFGRKDEKDEIVEWLLQESDEQLTVAVLAIIGMGGIGKTTLAQLVYNDPRVTVHFDLRAWICVSNDFDVMGLIKKIITSLSMNHDERPDLHELAHISNMNLDVLCRVLKKKLQGKRFFIVLDDVWNQKLNLWQSLKSSISGAGCGKIVLTTRNVSVARNMQTTAPIVLKELSFDDSLSLFVRIAFQGRDHNLLWNLLNIGKRIVKKCKGLPLAVKFLASILIFEDKEKKWNDVLESELWELENENNDVFPVLKLSYDRMPTELRPWFKYLSLFRKDSFLEKKAVVQQWMSQGFLHAKGKETEEDIGNSYFNELLDKSILQYSTSSKDSFVMHDLIHDLAQFVAKDEDLVITSDKLNQITQKIPGTIRHIAIYLKEDSDKTSLKSLFESNRLRTLMLHNVDGRSIAGSLRNLTCLRTLFLDDRNCFQQRTRELPDALGNLKHLRFLNVNRCVCTLEPICSLYLLQTFNSSNDDLELCKGIGDLINLRHLSGGSRWMANALCSMNHEVAWLTNLRTLNCYKVGSESWQCKLSDLKDLTNLHGGIEISGLENVESCDLALSKAYLKKPLQGIEELHLTWRLSERNEMEVEDETLAARVLSCFGRRPNLLELKITGYPCGMYPTWLADTSFSKLEKLTLSVCKCTSLPTLGQLPALKSLTIDIMENVEIVGREFLANPVAVDAGGATASVTRGCFPALERLRFAFMDEWKEWNGVEDWDFPQLSELTIFSCPMLRAIPSLHSLTRLDFVFGCDLEALSGCYLPRLRTLCLHGMLDRYLILPGSQSLPSLKVLIILGGRDRVDIEYIEGLENLTSLESLEIMGCDEAEITVHHDLQHLDEWEERNGMEDRDLPHLSELTIDSCLMLRTFPSLSSLTRLEFMYHCDLDALSDCHLPKLQTLCLRDLFNDYIVFPNCLSSLKVLIIDGGLYLESIGGFQNFTSLERLVIKRCEDARISRNEELPPSLWDVQICDSPRVERWYKNHVLGGGGSIDTQQTDSDTELEEEPGAE